MPEQCGRGSANDGLFIVLEEVPGVGHGLQVDTAGTVCVFLASGYRWATVMLEIPISSATH
jgi:hypothetical protein